MKDRSFINSLGSSLHQAALFVLAFAMGCAPMPKEDLIQKVEEPAEEIEGESPTEIAPDQEEPTPSAKHTFTDTIQEGKDFRHPALHFEMLWVPPGNFLIGSKQKDAPENEKSGALVRITRGFWLASKETTQELYEAVMQENPSDFKDAHKPVEGVAYYEALDFCNKLTRFEQAHGRLEPTLRYHLPTEAQWEFAAKGGAHAQKLDFPAVDQGTWHKGNSPGGPNRPAMKAPHPLGFYDIFGNVAEFCYGRAAPLPTTSETDWIGPQDGNFCVARGGSWYSPPGECSATNRLEVLPTFSMSMIGFRLALSTALAGK